ncbi:NACHT domain-containing protein [Prauserella cavernicola]|uniref:NACHT domain-containing protein n=1 Tax=Prauserella cavernicola TaxID=2800127 RepID=A0A934QTE2_9PSEU|nr:NACHT domain-containing protein [Prauserella cavernicola]MBK1785987.1 NACHT domain-containing protein [Prauserella cavernicola]
MSSRQPIAARGSSYNYEALLPEHFQNLVQALLAKNYPDLVCFPVGMPDGGRDAATSSLSMEGQTVIQVKFARDPSSLDDPTKWIIDALRGEKEKVERLVNRGAVKYLLVTNVAGTGHLDAGRIDKVDSYLKLHYPLSAACMWRDDLDRRLDGEFDLKLRYPQLLNGPDFVRLVWETKETSETLRRSRDTLEAYLRHQFRNDETLRFKQVEMLNTKLFDLFIDVPVSILPASDQESEKVDRFDYFARRAIRAAAAYRSENRTATEEGHFGHSSSDEIYLRHTRKTGAANLLTESEFTAESPKIIIEGAPGQGKSTLSQYLAQIHRAMYLGDSDSLSRIPKQHLSTVAMLPIKIELRDLAVWLQGIDPWDRSPSSKHEKMESLEAAIVGHIRRYSGGGEFSVSDFRSIVQSMPTLLILDALDEVADLSDRQAVVSEIEACIDRLAGAHDNLTVLVTSRPTALSNAPTLSKSRFTYLSLASIGPQLAVKYAGKWAKARRLPEREADEITSILESKLQSPHMAELAKNTMQLTILLSLILTRGSSLPDKRTELYTAYLDQFLSRESDKNKTVRDNRDLLLNIHGYLAYYLHARAEGHQLTGRLDHSELRTLLSDYLVSESRSTNLVDDLFNAVVERVVALVSRVEGTLEFEVQPLREYFAARHLYNTAPYSPAGREKRGTKPDRFDGISPNPYWMNVTRFFAGFFSKGELTDLAYRIIGLIDKSEDKYGMYPRRLALALLQDWVFAQEPRAVKLLVDRLFDPVGMAWLSQASKRDFFGAIPGQDYFSLSPDGGGAELASEILWMQISSIYKGDWTAHLCALLRSIEQPDNICSRWENRWKTLKTQEERTEWIEVAGWLGVASQIGAHRIHEILDNSRMDYDLAERRIQVCAMAPDMLEDLSTDKLDAFIRDYLNAGIILEFLPPYINTIGTFLATVNPNFWRFIQRQNIMRDFTEQMSQHWHHSTSEAHNQLTRISDEIFSNMQQNLNKSIEPWDSSIETIENRFGRTLTSVELACMSASVVSSRFRGTGAADLFEEATPLSSRMRYARRQQNNVKFWQTNLDRADTNEATVLWLCCAISWMSTDTMLRMLPSFDHAFNHIDLHMHRRLIQFARRAQGFSKVAQRTFDRERATELPIVSTPSYLLAYSRASKEARRVIFERFLEESNALDLVLPQALPMLIEELFNKERSHHLLDYMKNPCHRLVSQSFDEPVDIRRGRGTFRVGAFPLEEVLEDIEKFPATVTAVAFAVSDKRERKPTPVLKIAEREQWFEGA